MLTGLVDNFLYTDYQLLTPKIKTCLQVQKIRFRHPKIVFRFLMMIKGHFHTFFDTHSIDYDMALEGLPLHPQPKTLKKCQIDKKALKKFAYIKQ